MSEKINTTEANEVAKQKRLERLNAKKSAFNALAEIVKSSGNESALKALAVLTASKGRQAGTGIKSDILALLESDITVHESVIFERFKFGRGDMRKLTRFSVKNLSPADRHYITFNDETGEYTLEGIGEVPPAGYKGFLPTKGLERYNDGPYGHK